MQSPFAFLERLDLDQDVVSRLSQSLERVVVGNSEVYRTPFMKDTSPSEILTAWDKVFQRDETLLTRELLELENFQRSKFGPRSIAMPWVERKSNTLKYFEPEKIVLEPGSLFQQAQTMGRLRPVELEKAALSLKNDTNSGLPFYKRKGVVKERAVSQFAELLARKDPCVLFTRTQEARKTRDVWGFPIADTLNEMRFYRPVLEYQKRQPWRSAIVSPIAVDKAITWLIRDASTSNRLLVSMDFSAYDTSVKTSLQRESFLYIDSLFQRAYSEELEYIRQRFNTIALVTPDGVLGGPHGVPSGSTFTNEVDSVAQYLIAINSGQILSEDHLQIQGDDGAYSVEDPDALKERFREYGLVVNEDKSYVSKDYIIYLQNFYSPEYSRNGIIGGIYPVYRALTRLVFQETWDDFMDYGISGSDYYSIRAISILENCRNHPLFEELVRFVVSNDKYGLSVTDKGINQYVKMMNDSSGIQGIINNQYGDEVTGIRNFETFKLISKL